MGENSKIEWTHHTFNPWIGCAKVAAGCTHCYAESYANRYGKAKWGVDGTRVKTTAAYWKQPFKWNREAEMDGERRRVFCASLADVFEDWQGPIHNANGERLSRDENGYHTLNGRPDPWTTMDDLRRDLFAVIDATPHLDWLLLTKRPENIKKMWPKTPHGEHHHRVECECKQCWHRGNCWLLTSIAEQADADRNVPELIKCRDLVPVLGLSAEPLVGPVNIEVAWDGEPTLPTAQVDWVIVGGESGHHARSFNAEWARAIVAQCKAAGVPCFVKQMGENLFTTQRPNDWPDGTPNSKEYHRDYGDCWTLELKDRKGGDIHEWPKDLQVREFPTTATVEL